MSRYFLKPEEVVTIPGKYYLAELDIWVKLKKWDKAPSLPSTDLVWRLIYSEELSWIESKI